MVLKYQSTFNKNWQAALKTRKKGWLDSKKFTSVHQGMTVMLVPIFSKCFCFCTILEYTNTPIKLSKILGIAFW